MQSEQGGAGSGGGDAPDTGNQHNVTNEFTTGELGLVFLDEGQPSVVHLDDGAEVEVEAPAPLDPLTVEFARNPYTISECGKYEFIGDRRILRRKGTNGSRAYGPRFET